MNKRSGSTFKHQLPTEYNIKMVNEKKSCNSKITVKDNYNLLEPMKIVSFVLNFNYLVLTTDQNIIMIWELN
jgi:hypothetical protein